MHPILFWAFAALMILFGLMVIVLRNPVSSAMSLVLSFVCLSALFVSLDAFFIAIVQVLVYAGAVMVLFLFIIMLLDIRADARRRLNLPAFIGGLAVSTAFAFIVVNVIEKFPQGNVPAPELAARTEDVKMVGFALFTNFNLPLQIVGALVLVATIGVVVLSKRDLK